MPSRQPKKDEINFIAIKKEKTVTLSTLLPYVYDSYLLSYGRPELLEVFYSSDSYMASVNLVRPELFD
jgi:hypothetical protein